MKTLGFTVSIVLTVVLLATLVPGPGAAQPAGMTPDGKALFLGQKCNVCHSIPPAGVERTMKSSKAPDLVGLAKVDAKLLTGYLRKTAEINGKKHVKPFTGSDAELGALIAWLQKQEAK
ncbi:MAG: cytochrome c [Acidobacteriota bacterium]